MQDLASRPPETANAAGMLTQERDGGIAILTLNRPHSRNSLSAAMLGELQAAISGLSSDSGVHAVVIAANGPVYSSGHDLKELTAHRSDADAGRAFYADMMQRCAAVMQAIVNSPKPFIAAVEGAATAAGCQLVASCDLAVAGEEAQFCTPGVNIGLFCSTPMVALSRNVPRKRAMEMLLLGEMVSADDAERFGLVNRVVARGQALTEALTLARRIASKSPVTVALGKRAFYEQMEQRLQDAYITTSEVMVRNMLLADATEGIGAFLDKRDPKWTGC